MADGFEQLGEALAGLGGVNEAQRESAALRGAQTRNAMEEARARVIKNVANSRLEAALGDIMAGNADKEAASYATAAQAGVNLGDLLGGRLKQQEFNTRGRVADPARTEAQAQRDLLSLANSPQETFKAVGSHGYQNVLHPEEGVTQIGGTGAGGGAAAAIQIMEAYGMLDETGHVKPGMEEKAFDVMRSTQATVDAGGVPYRTSANPFSQRGSTPIAPPSGATGAVGPGTAGSSAMPAAPAMAPRTPVASLNEVAGNTREIERQKKLGAGQAEAALSLPAKYAQMRNITQAADVVTQNIDDALANTNWLSSGIAGWATRGIPGSPAFELNRLVDTVKANVGFQGLKNMRYESPTGGALGQVAVKELEFLQAALGNLETAQNPADLAKQLDAVKSHFAQFKQFSEQDFNIAQQMGTTGGFTPPGAGPRGYPSEAEAAAAAQRGEIQPGDKITVGGVSGTWQ